MKNYSIQCVLLFCAVGFSPVSGFAQADDVQVEQAIPVTGETAVQQVVEEVVVTGSRIRRDEFTSTSPISVITSESSALAGLLDTADILQNSTVASGQQIDDSFSGFVTDGGPGARSLALRGLGAQRTLVLVNGKRWGPSGVGGSTNSVDLSAIPSSVVSRYEILKDGASSIYGADAVAGVVNAITVQRFDGLQFNLQGGLPEEGGAETFVGDFTWGKVGTDWSFSVSGNYERRNDMVRTDRSWSECDRRPRFTDQDGGGNRDNTNPETGEPLCFGMVYSSVISPFGWVRYEPSLAEPVPDNPYFSGPQQSSIPYYTTVPPHGWDPTSDASDPDPLWDNEGAFYRDERGPFIADIVPDRELFSITSFADKDFDIGGRSANVYYEFYYNHRASSYSSGYRQYFPRVPATNPTNPFGIHGPLGSDGRGVAVLPLVPSYEVQNPDSTIEVNRYNAFAGLEGDISETWSYDAYVGYSYSNGTYKAQEWLDDRINASINAVLDADGNLVCADNAIAGCVPANLFTEDALLRGRLPADVLGFIRKDTLGETTYKGYQLSGYATGRLFGFPNGADVNAVLGFEMRGEDINDVPDLDAQVSNIWGTATAGITVGDDTVREFFTEIEVPLLAGVPFAEKVLFNGSGRWTDYDSYGSDTTYRIALDYQMTPQVRLRGTAGTSFRAPDLFEQFLANQTGFVPAFNRDPCINYGDIYESDDVIYRNCAAQGLEPDHGSQGAPSIRNVIGGNPDLLAETSDTWTAGIVVQSPDLGLSLALTWYEIELKNTVEDPSTAYILSTCYTSAGLANPFCNRVGPRDVDGFLTDVDASLLNVGRRFTRGFDTDFVFERAFPSFDLTIEGTVNILKEQTTELFDETWNSVNRWGFPKWTGVMDVIVDYRDWRVFWRMDVIGASAENPVFDPGTKNVDRQHWTEDHWEHTLSLRYSGADWKVIGAIRNIFDKQPPLVGDNVPRDATSRVFNTLPGVGYDILGRTIVVQLTKRF